MSLTKIFITRWALTEGVLVWEPPDPDDVTVREDGSLEIRRFGGEYIGADGHIVGGYPRPAFIAAGEWAYTEEEAATQERRHAAAKVKLLERRLPRLRRIAAGRGAFSTKPAKKSANWRAWGIDE